MAVRLITALAVIALPVVNIIPQYAPIGIDHAWAHPGPGTDNCPNDPNKNDPGQCGCGNPDIHSDGDGRADCIDNCPTVNNDHDNWNDTDGDGDGDACDPDIDADGTPNSSDDCPYDPALTTDIDSDGDGTLDCNDECRNDANKINPGQCGCGVTEDVGDADGDGKINCLDGCPNDGSKTAPGICGCGVSDADDDGDGTPNCNDGCPSDVDKTSPGICGCGVSDIDSDGDGAQDCNDGCPSNPNKQVKTDSNGDGIPDCLDCAVIGPPCSSSTLSAEYVDRIIKPIETTLIPLLNLLPRVAITGNVSGSGTGEFCKGCCAGTYFDPITVSGDVSVVGNLGFDAVLSPFAYSVNIPGTNIPVTLVIAPFVAGGITGGGSGGLDIDFCSGSSCVHGDISVGATGSVGGRAAAFVGSYGVRAEASGSAGGRFGVDYDSCGSTTPTGCWDPIVGAITIEIGSIWSYIYALTFWSGSCP